MRTIESIVRQQYRPLLRGSRSLDLLIRDCARFPSKPEAESETQSLRSALVVHVDGNRHPSQWSRSAALTAQLRTVRRVGLRFGSVLYLRRPVGAGTKPAERSPANFPKTDPKL
jgi:hypothetical protein